jgi:type VI secretion system protein ImpF
MAMSKVFSQETLRLSVLDRLLDENPGTQQETPLTYPQQLRILRQAVRRDLEDLLNTRRRVNGSPSELNALERSLVNYGLPDVTYLNLVSAEGREEFRRLIEATIRRCEPRFKSVKVKLLENAEPLDRTLHFHIDALLAIEPAPEPITFDTRLEPVTGSFTLKAEAP